MKQGAGMRFQAETALCRACGVKATRSRSKEYMQKQAANKKVAGTPGKSRKVVASDEADEENLED